MIAARAFELCGKHASAGQHRCCKYFVLAAHALCAHKCAQIDRIDLQGDIVLQKRAVCLVCKRAHLFIAGAVEQQLRHAKISAVSRFLFRLLHRAAHRRGECAAFISQHLLRVEAAAVHRKTRDLFSAALCLECKLCVMIIVFYLKYLYDALIRRQHAHFSVKRRARLRERALHVFERAAFQRRIAAFQNRFAALLRCVGVDHASGHCLR